MLRRNIKILYANLGLRERPVYMCNTFLVTLATYYQVTRTITDVQRTKIAEFLSVHCDSLGLRQKYLMIWRERRVNVIHLLCASISAHIFIFYMLKNVIVFSRVNLDVRKTLDHAQVDRTLQIRQRL